MTAMKRIEGMNCIKGIEKLEGMKSSKSVKRMRGVERIENIGSIKRLKAIYKRLYSGTFFLVLVALLLIQPFTIAGRTERVSMKGDHGALAGSMQIPDAVPTYPMVIIMHGFSSSKDAKLLQQIADDLEAVGIGSLRFDFNGHGDSEGRFQDMTVPNEITDAKAVYSYLRSEAENREAITSISLIGHSQGGVVASMLAGEIAKSEGNSAIQSIVLLAPAGNIKDGLIGSSFFGLQFNADELPDVVELPSGLKVGHQYFQTAYDLPIYEVAKAYTGPVAIVQGSEDMVVPTRYSRRFDQIYETSELHILDGYDHEFTQNPTEVSRLVRDFIVEHTKEQAQPTGTIDSWWQRIVSWIK